MLSDRSAKQLTLDIRGHLEEKMCDKTKSNWNLELQGIVDQVVQEGDFVPFTLAEMRAQLMTMKNRSAVGPDLVGVHLLREIANHDLLCLDLLSLINHIVSTQELPAIWERSFLGLLAKCHHPTGPKDLRPICVSSLSEAYQ